MKILKSGIFWAVLIGIITIIASIILSNKRSKPVFTVKVPSSTIFDKEKSSPRIKLLVDDSIFVEKNVYYSSIVIWNAGKLEIDKENLRSDITIGVSDGGEILDYSILLQTHPSISNFRICEKDSIHTLDWDYFDPGFGLLLQLIYSGSNESEVFVEGYVLNNHVKKAGLIMTKLGAYILSSLIVFVLMITAIILTRKKRFWESIGPTKGFFMGLGISFGTSMLLSVVIILLRGITTVPL